MIFEKGFFVKLLDSFCERHNISILWIAVTIGTIILILLIKFPRRTGLRKWINIFIYGIVLLLSIIVAIEDQIRILNR